MSFYQSAKPALHIQPSHFGTPRSQYYYGYDQAHAHLAHASQSDPMDVKVQLRNRLANGALERMPAGFPFHYSMTGCGTPILSYDSFEFREIFLPVGRRSSIRPTHATISFHNPGESQKKIRFFTWSVYIPKSNSCLSWKDTSRTPVALVKLDPALLDTPYGRFLRKSPTVILRALSISLELGIPITITSLDKTVVPLMPHARTRDSWQIGDVVYIGTKPDGRQEVLYVTHH